MRFWNWGAQKPPEPPPPPNITQEWVDDVSERTKYTPDILELQSRRAALFFIHDDLKKGHPNHDLIADSCVPLAQGFTQESFTFLKRRTQSGGFQPMAMRRKFFTLPHLPILGTVCAVHPAQVPVLDRLRKNGVTYDRERVKVRIISRSKRLIGHVKETVMDLSMYILKPEKAELVDNGYAFAPVKTFGKAKFADDRTGDYSFYSRLEYDQQTNSS